MRNPLASENSTNLGILVARLALGAQLLFIGYAHMNNRGVSAPTAGAIPRWMPGEAAGGYAQCLPYLEFAAGGMLVLGLTTRVGGLLAGLMTAIVMAARGVHFHPHPEEDLPIYLAVSILLLCLGGGRFTLDRLLFRRKHSEMDPSGGH
jgi:putative oxidoreductase